eukprot:SAG31_NODE_3266_length_4472_cov_4.101142_3_plen_184_part_00
MSEGWRQFRTASCRPQRRACNQYRSGQLSGTERARTGVLVGSGVREALGLAGGTAEQAGEVRALLVALGGVDLVALQALGLEDLCASLRSALRDGDVWHWLVAPAAQAQHQVESGLLLDVVVSESAAVFELLAGEDEALLVRGDPLLVLDLGLHVLNGVRSFHIKGDGLAGEGLRPGVAVEVS